MVVYSVDDRYQLRNEIAALRNQIRYEKQNDAYVGLEVQRSLDDASMALDDAAQMLAWGYARSDIRAAIYDAEAFINYARQERAYALESLRAYQQHAQTQLQEVQYYTQTPGYFTDAQARVTAAQRAYEEADLLARAKANSDETLAAYKAAAQRADSSMRALYASFDTQDGSFTYLRSEYDTLETWMNQVLEYAEEWKSAQAIRTLRTAKIALDKASVAIEHKDAETARIALDDAANSIDAATLQLSPES